MPILYRSVIALLPLLLWACFATADEPVVGPPEMIIDARIEDETLNGKLFVGTTMDWGQNRQSWNRDSMIEHGGRSVAVSIDRGRSVHVIREARFAVPVDMLKLAHFFVTLLQL